MILSKYPLSESALIDLFDEYCRDDSWREVLRLVCSQIDEQFVGEIIEYLIARANLEEWDGRKPLPEIPFTIWCLSEVRSFVHLKSVGDRLFRACMTLFEKSTETNDDFFGHLVEAAKNIGTMWPLSQQPSLSLEWDEENIWGQLYWPQFIAYVLGDRLMLSQFLHEKSIRLRIGALMSSAKTWPDETTRELLTQYAIHDENASLRRVALEALAQTWPDTTTRELLTQYAIYNENASLRRAAVETLAKTWPDATTRDLLTQRALHDPDEMPRGEAWTALGKMHSEFGRILPTEDLDGLEPYLDPLEPTPRDHIEKAAKQVGIPAEDIDAQVAALSAHCGWDITVGARPSNNDSPE